MESIWKWWVCENGTEQVEGAPTGQRRAQRALTKVSEQPESQQACTRTRGGAPVAPGAWQGLSRHAPESIRTARPPRNQGTRSTQRRVSHLKSFSQTRVGLPDRTTRNSPGSHLCDLLAPDLNCPTSTMSQKLGIQEQTGTAPASSEFKILWERQISKQTVYKSGFTPSFNHFAEHVLCAGHEQSSWSSSLHFSGRKLVTQLPIYTSPCCVGEIECSGSEDKDAWCAEKQRQDLGAKHAVRGHAAHGERPAEDRASELWGKFWYSPWEQQGFLTALHRELTVYICFINMMQGTCWRDIGQQLRCPGGRWRQPTLGTMPLKEKPQGT